MKVAQSCLTLCNPMGYTVNWILQARILEWVAFPFSRGSSHLRDWAQVSHIAGGFFTVWAIRETKTYQTQNLSLKAKSTVLVSWNSKSTREMVLLTFNQYILVEIHVIEERYTLQIWSKYGASCLWGRDIWANLEDTVWLKKLKDRGDVGRKRNNISKDTKIKANLLNYKMSQELGNSVLELEFMLFRAVLRDETEETENSIIVKKTNKSCIRSWQSTYTKFKYVKSTERINM